MSRTSLLFLHLRIYERAVSLELTIRLLQSRALTRLGDARQTGEADGEI